MEQSGTIKERQYVIHLNSDEFEKEPAVSGLNFGEIAVNYCSGSPAIYIKTQSGETSGSQYLIEFRDVDWIMDHFSGGSPDVAALVRDLRRLSASTEALYDYVDVVSGDVNSYYEDFTEFSGYVVENFVKSIDFSDSGAGQSNVGLERVGTSGEGFTYTFDFSKMEINCGSF